MKVLMLGWEFPPHKSGGLGTACEGLTRGLAEHSVEVLMVVPRLVGGEQVASGRMLEAARALSAAAAAESSAAEREIAVPVVANTEIRGLEIVGVASPLRPYLDAGTELRGGYGPDLFREVERYAQAAGSIAAAERFDVIHAHDWMTLDAGLRARERSGKPLVWHVHASEHDRNRDAPDARIAAIEQRGVEQADRVVCVSHYTATKLREHYDAAPERLRVVHNATQPARDRRVRAWRARRPFAEPLALFMGRVTSQKGPDVFLDAAARLVRAGTPIKFALAGDGDLWSGCVERAAELGLARHMYFPGFLQGDAVTRMHALADLFVMPSVSEPFGIAPLEAMSLGTPVLLTRQSGVSELVDSVIKFDAGDSAGLAQAMQALAEDPFLRSWLGARGREEAQRLRWGGAGAKVADLYRELTA